MFSDLFYQLIEENIFLLGSEIKPKEQKRIDSNQKIIFSAIKEFASKGYTNAKLTSIAKEASVTAGLIGQRYGTKDNLVLTIIKDNLLMNDEDLSSSNNNLFLILEKLRIISTSK